MEAVVATRGTLALRRLRRLLWRLNNFRYLLCAIVNNRGHVVGRDKQFALLRQVKVGHVDIAELWVRVLRVEAKDFLTRIDVPDDDQVVSFDRYANKAAV